MVKNHRVYIRFDSFEKERIERKARQLGMSPGVYLRFLGLNVDISVRDIKLSSSDKSCTALLNKESLEEEWEETPTKKRRLSLCQKN